MSKISPILIALTAITIGLGVPTISLYANLFYDFNFVATSIIALLAVLIGGGVIIVGVILGPMGKESDDSGRVERQRLRMLREQQRANLEELDGIVGVLGEIRDILKAVEE